MSYLLDTNVISEISKPAPNPNCIAWMTAHAEESSLCSVTLAEMRWGIERLPEGKKKSEREREFRFLMEDFRERLYEFDGAAAFEWGRLAAEIEAAQGSDWWKYCDLRDTQIAAIAREHGLIVATRNEKHFPFCKTENPFA
jgi:toxin FitB